MTVAELGPTSSLSAGLWAFVWKALGVSWTLAYVVFALVFALPTATSLGYGPDLLTELAVSGAETILTMFGIVLIFRRHRHVRLSWLAALVLYCAMRIAEVFLSEEPIGAAFLLLSGVGWLTYWLLASAARQVGLVRFWQTPDRGAA